MSSDEGLGEKNQCLILVEKGQKGVGQGWEAG